MVTVTNKIQIDYSNSMAMVHVATMMMMTTMKMMVVVVPMPMAAIWECFSLPEMAPRMILIWIHLCHVIVGTVSHSMTYLNLCVVAVVGSDSDSGPYSDPVDMVFAVFAAVGSEEKKPIAINSFQLVTWIASMASV